MCKLNRNIVLNRPGLKPEYTDSTRTLGLRETNKFNGNLLVIQQVGPLKNDTKGTLSNLFAHSIVNTDHVRRGGRHGEFSSSSLDVCVEKESL